ncbi:MAG: hypothetical protein VZR11_14070 [Succinimonas sp.]|nr:hypothetical protein [Succinimonas sp.]
MRATQHSSRTDSAGRVHGRKHNDRNFDTSKADNIAQSRMRENLYWNCYDGKYREADKAGKMTFAEAELRAYEELFGTQLEATNARYMLQGHPERIRSMGQWMSQRMHAPEEVVVQVGSVEQMPDRDMARACLLDYVRNLKDWNADHGFPMQIMTVALHMDEAIPHIQIRRTWAYEDNGDLRQGQDKALEAAGVPLPDPGKAPGRRNNRKMTFDSEMRSIWLDICHSHGLTVERDPLPDARHGMDKAEMIREKHARALAETEQLRREAAEIKVSTAVKKAMANTSAEEPKKIPLTDLVAIPAEEYGALRRRSEGLEAAMEDAVQLRYDMDADRIRAGMEVEKALEEAKSIVQKAREEAGRIKGSARVEALLDGTRAKISRYEQLEKRFPEAFEEMDRMLSAERPGKTIGRNREK